MNATSNLTLRIHARAPCPTMARLTARTSPPSAMSLHPGAGSSLRSGIELVKTVIPSRERSLTPTLKAVVPEST
jgi:hypothetical protein